MHILLSHFSLCYALNNDTEYANALNNSAEPCLDLHAMVWSDLFEFCTSFVFPAVYFFSRAYSSPC